MAEGSIEQLFADAADAQQAGRLPQAEELFRALLARHPDHPDGLHGLALVQFQLGRREPAILTLKRALRSENPDPACVANLAHMLSQVGRLDEALAMYSRLAELRPDFVDAHFQLARHLQLIGRIPQAISAYRKALVLNPDFAGAHNNLGLCLNSSGKFDEAVASFERAVQIQPDFAEAWSNLGNIRKDCAQLDEALACFDKAAALRPESIGASCNKLYTLHFHPDYDAKAIFDAHKQWHDQHALPLTSRIQPQRNSRDPDRRLRIGYVSPDFRNHCQAMFTLPLLSNHDREKFEIYGYSSVYTSDETTAQLRSHTDAWRDVPTKTDEQLAAIIRDDRIDILVDLTMHMANGRPLLFARKPAPVQVAWLAYPGTTGQSAIDYRITDPYLDPEGSDLYYSEKSIRLPDTFWCYNPPPAGPFPAALPALMNGCITFGSLNNFCKINRPTLGLWSKVLSAVPDSRLILRAPAGPPRQKVLDALAVHPDRIQFIDFQPREAYLNTFNRIDLGLDAIPYNGHTTSLDSFWMGVPVITRIGRTIVGRAGWSQLCNLDLKELAATTDEEFVRLAVSWSKDLSRLAQLRATLRTRMEKSPLMDAPRFARNMEAAYRQMWASWCEKQSLMA